MNSVIPAEPGWSAYYPDFISDDELASGLLPIDRFNPVVGWVVIVGLDKSSFPERASAVPVVAGSIAHDDDILRSPDGKFGWGGEWMSQDMLVSDLLQRRDQGKS